MTKEKLAELLHGREYGDDITKEETAEYRKSGLVIVFGASDDLLEFRGAIYEELGAFNGTIAKVFKKGDKWEAVNEEDFEEEKIKMSEYGIDLKGFQIEAEWSPTEPECSWLIKTEIPHATFDIMEDGELFCRGIVFSIDELQTL
jgi:hypothetical protein